MAVDISQPIQKAVQSAPHGLPDCAHHSISLRTGIFVRTDLYGNGNSKYSTSRLFTSGQKNQNTSNRTLTTTNYY